MDDSKRRSLLETIAVFEQQREAVSATGNDFVVFLIDLVIMELRVQTGRISESELAELSTVLRDKLAVR